MSKDEILKRLKKLNNIGKTISGEIKGTTRKENKGKIEDEIAHIVDENKYVIQKIKRSDNTIGFRFGYYTCDAKYTQLRYGESSPILSESDFKVLMNKAKEKGWITTNNNCELTERNIIVKLEADQTSNWINFIIHKRNMLNNITDNIWNSYYSERGISLTAITILTTSILALISIAIQLNSISLESPILILAGFVGGVDIAWIIYHIHLWKETMDGIKKYIPFRRVYEEMLQELIDGKFENIEQLRKKYSEQIKPLQDIFNEETEKFINSVPQTPNKK
jgi:hypothetical protein